MQDLGETTINPTLHHTVVTNNITSPTQIKDNRHSSCKRNRKLTHKPHAKPRQHQTRSSERSQN